MLTTFTPGPDAVARYAAVRSRQREMSSRFLAFIPKHVMEAIGAKLGIVRGGVYCVDSEQECNVLADCCLFDWIVDGKSLIERFGEVMPADAPPEERALVEIMLRARFAIIAIEDVVPGAGAWALDLADRERIFLMDEKLSHSAEPGTLLATRLFPLDDFWITGGAAISVGNAPSRVSVEKIASNFPFDITRDPEDRVAFVRGCLDRIRGPGYATEPIVLERPIRAVARPGRNAACPCGSGEKYKHCCAS